MIASKIKIVLHKLLWPAKKEKVRVLLLLWNAPNVAITIASDRQGFPVTPRPKIAVTPPHV